MNVDKMITNANLYALKHCPLMGLQIKVLVSYSACHSVRAFVHICCHLFWPDSIQRGYYHLGMDGGVA